MGKLLTVVVPSDNAGKYLKQILESCADERILDDLDVLIIDDGSMKRTAEIGKEYEEKYPQSFRLITRVNGGQGSAVNAGIEAGSGRYFKVIGDGEWINTPDFIKLLTKLKECEADYVITNYYEVDNQTKEETAETFPGLTQDKVIEFDEVAGDFQIGIQSLVIKTSILKEHNIQIHEHIFYADAEYILYPIPYVETAIYYDLFASKHRLVPLEQRISMQRDQKHMQDHRAVIFYLVDFFNAYRKQHGKRDKIQYIGKRTARMIGDQITIFMSFPLEDKEIKRQFIEFDKKLKEKSKLMYQMSGEESGMLRTLRKYKFKWYKTIIHLSRLRNGLKEQKTEQSKIS